MRRVLLVSILLYTLPFVSVSQAKKSTTQTIKKKKVPKSENSASLEETQNWIKEYIEQFSYEVDWLNHTMKGTLRYEVSFTNCTIIIKHILDVDFLDKADGMWKKKHSIETNEIPAKHLGKLNFRKNRDETIIDIKTKNLDNLIKETTESNVGTPLETKYTYIDVLSTPTSKIENNILERLSTAFEHYAFLCGGIHNDTF